MTCFRIGYLQTFEKSVCSEKLFGLPFFFLLTLPRIIHHEIPWTCSQFCFTERNEMKSRTGLRMLKMGGSLKEKH